MYIVSVLLGEQLSQSFGPCHVCGTVAELCEQEQLVLLPSLLKFLSQLLLAHFYLKRESSLWLLL